MNNVGFGFGFGFGNNLHTQGGLLNQFDELAPTLLSATAVSDVQIDLAWTVNSTNADGHKIERSTDGITYTEIGSVLGTTTTYTDTTGSDGTRYYYRVRAYQGTSYSAYGTAANDWTAIKMVLTSTGTGAGVSSVRFWFGADVVVTLDGNGKWYSDAAGTADESAAYTFTGGSLQTRYLKVTSGVSNMLLFAKGNWLQWGNLVYDPATGALTTISDGFASSTNAATIAKDISTLTTLVKLYIGGSNTLSGSVANLTNLTYLRVAGSNTLTGSVAGLTNLTYLFVAGSNTLSGSVAGLTNLTYMFVLGSNTLTGSVAGLTNLTYLSIVGLNTLSGSVAGLTSLTHLDVGSNNTLSGSVAGLTSLTVLYVRGSNTLSGSVAGLTNLTYLRVEGLNTLSGDIGKVGATAMVEGITEIHLGTTNQMNTYTAGAVWSLTGSSDINPDVGYGYDSTEIDNMLIDMAASLGTVVDKTITLQGSSQARTAASDAAVATLNGKGWTVVTN